MNKWFRKTEVHPARASAAPGTFLSSLEEIRQLYPVGIGKAYIYALIDPRTGLIRYVGKTFNVVGRYNQHCRGKGPAYCAKWIRSLLVDGIKPDVEVVDIVNSLNSADWEQSERQWIANFKLMGFKLTNLTPGGDSGWTLTDDAKERISIAQKGKKKPAHVGRAVAEANKRRSNEWWAWKAQQAHNISDETRAKMRAAAINMGQEKKDAIRLKVKQHWANGVFKKMPKEKYAQIALKNTGRKRSEETKEKIRIAARRRAANLEWRKNHSLALTGRKLRPESILKREATRRAKWLAAKEVIS